MRGEILEGSFTEKEIKKVNLETKLRISGIVRHEKKRGGRSYTVTIDNFPKTVLFEINDTQMKKLDFTPIAREQLIKIKRN